MIKAYRVTVQTTPTLISTEDTTIPAGPVDATLMVKAGTSDVYLGGASVTTSDGFKLSAGTSMSFDLIRGEKLYGIVAAGSVEVSVIGSGL